MTGSTILAMLVIGQLVHTPAGYVFLAEDRVLYETIEECWSAAIRITSEPTSPQLGMCSPAKRKAQDASR
tara:strand:+ start:1242 stop:1451 length:210 start_codon:yes stop_codon:yes gene_type:complete